MVGSQFGVSVTGTGGQTYILLTASNLLAPVWVPVATNVAVTNGTFQLADPGSTNAPQRFYRVSTP